MNGHGNVFANQARKTGCHVHWARRGGVSLGDQAEEENAPKLQTHVRRNLCPAERPRSPRRPPRPTVSAAGPELGETLMALALGAKAAGREGVACVPALTARPGVWPPPCALRR